MGLSCLDSSQSGPIINYAHRKGSDEEDYMDYKWSKPMSFKNRIRAGRGRARSMALGATSIINKWPDHLLVCWLASIAFITICVACTLLIVGLARNPLSGYTGQEQCLMKNTHAGRHDTTTKTNMYLHILVNNNEVFDPLKFKSTLVSTIEHHPNYIINLFVLFNDMSEGSYRRNSRFKNWELYHRGIGNYEFFDTSSSEDDDSTDVAPIDITDSAIPQENIKIVQSTFSNYFKHSPLKDTWKHLPSEIIPVVMRILTLWEHGGATLPIQMFLDKTDIYCENKSSNSKLQHLVAELKNKFSGNIDDVDPAKIDADTKNSLKKELQGISFEAGLRPDDARQTFRTLKAAMSESESEANSVYPTTKMPNDSTAKRLMERKEALRAAMDQRAMLIQNLTKVAGKDFSSRYESSSYESSYDYSSESSDGLPDSTESRSVEFHLRPDLTPEFVNSEIIRYVNGKIDKEAIMRRIIESERRNKIRRELYSISSEESELSSSEESESSSSEESESSSSEETVVPGNLETILNLPNYQNNQNSVSSASKELIRQIKEALQRDPILARPVLDFQIDYRSLERKPDTSSSSESDSASYLSVSSESDSASYGSQSLEELTRQLHAMSDADFRPYTRVRENNDYKSMNFFEALNIFTLPTKATLALDVSGYYFAARKPCHAFLWQLISILRNKFNFYAADELISDGLKEFCREQNYTQCPGISLLL